MPSDAPLATSFVPRRGAAALALLLTLPVPAIGTYLAMVAFPESGLAKGLFAVAKVWLLVAPLVWVKCVEKRPLRWPRWSNRGMLAAHATGVAIFAVIVGAYFGFARSWIDTGPMLAKAGELGFDRPMVFAVAAAWYCLVNAMLEEYFWRWFIDGRWRDALGGGRAGAVVAAGLTALGFTAHHVIALDAYFGWAVTLLGSAGVAIGSLTWTTLYRRYGNLYAAWVSHVWADLAVFGLGAWLIFG